MHDMEQFDLEWEWRSEYGVFLLISNNVHINTKAEKVESFNRNIFNRFNMS